MSDAYLSPPDAQDRTGVLVLHSWWGLDPVARGICDRFADAGYLALAPDLIEGRRPGDPDEARTMLADASPDVMAATVLVSLDVLRERTGRPDGKVAVVGFGMGGSMALWLAARRPDRIGLVVSLYGTQSIDFDDVNASVQLHYSEFGGLVDEEERVTTEAFLHLGGAPPDVYVYDGVADGFAEPGRDEYDEAAAEAAWERIVAGVAALAD